MLSSKVGRLLVPNETPTGTDDDGFAVPDDLRRQWDFSRDGVLRSIEATLHRTGLDRLDIVYVHDPDDHWQQAADEAMPALAQLRDEGVVGAIGAGMNQSAMLARFLRETAADVVMLAGRYTLLDQGALDDVLPAALEHGKSVVAVGVFNSGLLAKRPAVRRHEIRLSGRSRAPGRPRAGDRRRLRDSTAPRFPPPPSPSRSRIPRLSTSRSACATPQQVARNIELYRKSVPEQLWADLRSRDLIRN